MAQLDHQMGIVTPSRVPPDWVWGRCHGQEHLRAAGRTCLPPGVCQPSPGKPRGLGRRKATAAGARELAGHCSWEEAALVNTTAKTSRARRQHIRSVTVSTVAQQPVQWLRDSALESERLARGFGRYVFTCSGAGAHDVHAHQCQPCRSVMPHLSYWAAPGFTGLCPTSMSDVENGALTHTFLFAGERSRHQTPPWLWAEGTINIGLHPKGQSA